MHRAGVGASGRSSADADAAASAWSRSELGHEQRPFWVHNVIAAGGWFALVRDHDVEILDSNLHEVATVTVDPNPDELWTASRVGDERSTRVAIVLRYYTPGDAGSTIRVLDVATASWVAPAVPIGGLPFVYAPFGDHAFFAVLQNVADTNAQAMYGMVVAADGSVTKKRWYEPPPDDIASSETGGRSLDGRMFVQWSHAHDFHDVEMFVTEVESDGSVRLPAPALPTPDSNFGIAGSDGLYILDHDGLFRWICR